MKKQRKFIGDKKFYKHMLFIAVPIMIQNGITNVVNLLDNIMVGQVGTEQMTGVAIVNQLYFVYFLLIFGGLSGVGIFTAQYFGQRNDEGIRHTFRYKLWLGLVIAIIAMSAFTFFGEQLMSLYLNSSTSVGDVGATLAYGKTYMSIIIFAMPPVFIVTAYSGTLRDCGRTAMPMVAGICAVLVNLVLDYALIFGHFGLPKLGVAGAAIATVIARYVEMLIVVIYCHTHTRIYTYVKGLYKTLIVPKKMSKEFFKKGIPILVNEGLWSVGMAFLMQCYSVRGLEVIAAININNVVSNVLAVIFFAMGDTVAIVVGQLLGAGKMEEARSTDTKIIFLAVMLGCVVGIGLCFASKIFPNLYNTSDEVKSLATKIIFVQAIFSPQIALLHSSYFTLRAGGRTIITFLFDSGATWFVDVPVAFCLSRFTGLDVLSIFIAENLCELAKSMLGIYLVKRGIWMNTITV